ncbi:MAG: hydroxymethylbilane synthase, partial [Halobacteriovoraceae bacterium]|nr:hydroxymethylbilane synthase [Halobacteriovoraceae bacterium]
MSKRYIIGTRGSLLARGQAGLVARELKKLTGMDFDLKTIKTQGDLQTDKPLWQMEGRDFFSKELDSALRNEQVDLVVHSCKDLSWQRPSDFVLAAITERHYSPDILLVKKEVAANISSFKKITIGTSSLRRTANLKDSLSAFLPGHPEVNAVPIRGNVPTRIEKIHKGDYQGIVLALAGLARLAEVEESRPVIEKLLASLDFMIMPESLFPGAAAQGALALECLKKRKDLQKILSLLNHSDTRKEVDKEREALAGYGGRCHLAVGITVKKIREHFLHIHKGIWNEKKIYKKWLESPGKISLSSPGFIGIPQKRMTDERFYYDFLLEKIPLDDVYTSREGNFFVASPYGIPALKTIFKKGIIWTSGVSTMKKLVNEGLWVHGSVDSLGDKEIIEKKDSAVFRMLLGERPWKVLTCDSVDSSLGEVIGTYRRTIREPAGDRRDMMKRIKSFYWTSFYQYERYREFFPFIEEARH